MDIKNKNGFTEKEYLQKYDIEKFERPSVACDIVLFTIMNEDRGNRKLPQKKFKLLMIKRGEHPFIGQWALAGGFVHYGETTEQTAQRELFEETGVKDVYLEQLYTFSDSKRDPRGWILSCSYMALVNSQSMKIQAGDDADEVAWFDLSYQLYKEEKEIKQDKIIKKNYYHLTLTYETISLKAEILVTKEIKNCNTKLEYTILSSCGIAFDHAKIIAYAVERLRGKLKYTDIAFSLLPEFFTLSDLQKVYEIILDKELLAPAFRREIANKVVETDKFTKKSAHRPSRLYRRNLEM